MDPTVLIGFALVALLAVVGALAMPAMLRDQRRRQASGTGGAGGLGAGLDAVWRPSAEEAHADWQAAVQMPAPAPAPGDKGLDDGPLVIDVAQEPDGRGDERDQS